MFDAAEISSSRNTMSLSTPSLRYVIGEEKTHRYVISEETNQFTKQNFVLQGVKHIFENNTFYFNNKHCKQKKVTAMGTKFASVYTTLVMG